MSVKPSDAAVTADLPNVSSQTFAVTLSAGANRLLVAVLSNGVGALRTVSSITYDGAGLAQIRRKASDPESIDLWGIDNPTTGVAKNVIVTLSGGARGGIVAQGFAGYTGTGAQGDALGNAVALTNVADQSLVFSVMMSLGGDTFSAYASAYQSSAANFIGAAGAGGNSVRCTANLMRGYPSDPGQNTDLGPAGPIIMAVELQGAADVIVNTGGSGGSGWQQWRRMHPRKLGLRL